MTFSFFAISSRWCNAEKEPKPRNVPCLARMYKYNDTYSDTYLDSRGFPLPASTHPTHHVWPYLPDGRPDRQKDRQTVWGSRWGQRCLVSWRLWGGPAWFSYSSSDGRAFLCRLASRRLASNFAPGQDVHTLLYCTYLPSQHEGTNNVVKNKCST